MSDQPMPGRSRGIHGERVPQLRDDAVKVVQLRSDGMHQHQGGSGACGEVPQAGSVGASEVLDSAVAVGPAVGVAHADTGSGWCRSAAACRALAGSSQATMTAAPAAMPAQTNEPTCSPSRNAALTAARTSGMACWGSRLMTW